MVELLTFNQRVWQLTAQIPRGRVSTYGLIAKALGQPKAARAVGNALNKNPHPFINKGCRMTPKALRVPCHRVVRAGGQLGGYALGTLKKRQILTQEGLKIAKKGAMFKVVNFEKVLYSKFF